MGSVFLLPPAPSIEAVCHRGYNRRTPKGVCVRHPALLLALGLAITTASPVSTTAPADVDPQRKWLEIKTPNFIVVGDAGARQLRQVVERM